MLGFLYNSIVDAKKSEEAYKNAQKAISAFKVENKTCPLCGQLWRED